MREKPVPFHPVAEVFPLLTGPEFDELVADIKERGLMEPITRHDGQILDGRNRYRACQAADVTPAFVDYLGDKSQEAVIAFVVSANLRRRHLTASQKAMVALDLLPHIEAAAKERQLASLKKGKASPVSQIVDERDKGRSDEHAAKAVGANRQYVADAKKVATEAPDLMAKVRAGELTVPQAKKETRKRKRAQEKSEQLAALPAGRKMPRLLVGKAEAMPGIASETVDIIITSPPYNLGADEWPMGGEGRKPRGEGIGYGDAMPEAEYQAWQIACLVEMWRVAKPGASLFYNHKVRQRKGTISHPMDWLRSDRVPWTIRQEIIWDRGSTHNHAAQLFWPEDERVYWLTKGKPTLPDRPIGMSTVWRFHGPVADTWHPAPFPKELPQRCLQVLGREGITILDPFAGSCTTLSAALELGYEAIGVDASLDYLVKAAKEHGWKRPSNA